MEQNIFYETVIYWDICKQGEAGEKKLKGVCRDQRKLFCFVFFEILVFSVWIEFTEEFLGLKMTLNHEAETYFKVLSSMDLWWKPRFPLSPSVIKENAE